MLTSPTRPARPRGPGDSRQKGLPRPRPAHCAQGSAVTVGGVHSAWEAGKRPSVAASVSPSPALGGRGRDASVASAERSRNASPGCRCPFPRCMYPFCVPLSGRMGHHRATDPEFRAVESHADRKASEVTRGSLPRPGPGARIHLVAQTIGMRWVA